MTRRSSIAGALLAGLLAACITVGKEITEDQLAEFKPGQTTLQDVIAKLGQPTSETINADGRRYISYTFVHAQPRAISFVPVVGAFAGGADSRSRIVMLIFGPDGKLQDFQATHSQFGSGTGAAAGTYQSPTPDQPREAPRK